MQIITAIYLNLNALSEKLFFPWNICIILNVLISGYLLFAFYYYFIRATLNEIAAAAIASAIFDKSAVWKEYN